MLQACCWGTGVSQDARFAPLAPARIVSSFKQQTCRDRAMAADSWLCSRRQFLELPTSSGTEGIHSCRSSAYPPWLCLLPQLTASSDAKLLSSLRLQQSEKCRAHQTDQDPGSHGDRPPALTRSHMGLPSHVLRSSRIHSFFFRPSNCSSYGPRAYKLMNEALTFVQMKSDCRDTGAKARVGDALTFTVGMAADSPFFLCRLDVFSFHTQTTTC